MLYAAKRTSSTCCSCAGSASDRISPDAAEVIEGLRTIGRIISPADTSPTG